MPRIIANNGIFFLLWPIFFCTFISAKKDVLNCMIKDGKTEIHLNFVKTKQLLANEHLPVWTAKAVDEASWRHNPGIAHHVLHKNFMKDKIGSFILYHDVEKSSAVVYYENTKTLHGFIDTRYKISRMRIDECNHGHHVDGKYVHRYEENMDIHDYSEQLDFSGHRNKPTLECPKYTNLQEFHKERQDLHKTSDEEPETIFYPEILILVPYDLIKYTQISDPGNALVTIMRNFIEYFNVVDMLWAKLSTNYIKIHLNLAGIVFEERSDVFSFMKPTYVRSDKHPAIKIKYLNGDRTLELVSVYLKQNINPFPLDSFDVFFIPSRTSIWSHTDKRSPTGYSQMGEYFKARRDSLYKYLAGMIVQHGNQFGFIVAAHEIGHLLDISHEPEWEGRYKAGGQCYAIMKVRNDYCPDCLKWTNKNIRDLQKFARGHLNRCFLLNKPRSLHPHGYPMRALSRLQQCRCYGYEHWPIKNQRDYLDEVPHTDCDQKMICGNFSKEVRTILPLDGTPCDENKVCWNEGCRNIHYGTGSVLQGISSHKNNY